ncbi:serine hydrolase domain-containing protein [Ideonella sp.]|uniref:serine hydrolase domain-containing protein n=1 Tax=Ideonella sp. TaxID=1929293 RepID=UPI0035B4BB9D
MLGVAVSLAVPAALAQPAARPAMSAGDLSAFFDAYLPGELKQADIAGAAVIVVKDGRVLFQRGYGWADRERQRAVSPDTTLFRIGSVSKLLTWTAVMQLVEQGQLVLDADVQQYLDFPLPPYQGQPVTLRQLMTHTAGFEETVQGMWMQPGESAALGDYLRAQLPPRIFAPGSTAAYSNYGATLAGYIVERRSGQAFADHLQRHLLRPLGMTHTSFAQPLPAALAAGLSQGYDLGSGAAQPFEGVRVVPAGSASATVADMGRFMLAQLGGGEAAPGDAVPAALSPTWLARMQAPQWRLHPGAPAMTLGFWEDDAFGPRVIGHGGDTLCFHSGLYLLPEQRVGLFFVQNSAGKRVLRDALFHRFVERYIGGPPAPVAAAEADGDRSLEGSYMSSRRAEHSPGKLGSLLSQVTVARTADGQLMVSSVRDADGQPMPLRPVGSGVWQSVGGGTPESASRRVYFRRNAQGRWEMGGHVPVAVWQQAAWYERAGVVGGALAAALLVSALTLLAWPAGAAWRRLRRRSPMPTPMPTPTPAIRVLRRAARWSALFTLLPWLALLGAMGWLMADALAVTGPAFGHTLRLVQGLAWLALGATVLAAWVPWRRAAQGAGRWQRWHLVLVVAAGLVAAAVAWQGGLLWWGGRY